MRVKWTTAQGLAVVIALLPLLAAWNPLQRPNRAVTDGNASLQKGKRRRLSPTTTSGCGAAG